VVRGVFGPRHGRGVMNELSPWPQTTTSFTCGWTDAAGARWDSSRDQDEPPMDGGEGVREPRRPPPSAPPGAAVVDIPVLPG
jgi:hypothetical protein